ncbi:glutaminyl-tRNA synthase (glutamine-hydrolyzing) subunit B [Candidatus Collierbacteria bacterium CG1_02_44_10]|uniref:Aspartyl/glutamyl-tRNA(Asn/Gln) amidotransferase subunit B n=1 Tax=Candidatus Collierbacteria bacterium CG1_02_44_10 TaxID=1805087 RepID=A0A1J4RX81_9BACT|nr:MAG: glutaminyl-tRNA synthase (glutamine-hydrolyzing) subunit B [Candidatus Collierbacteria bacterium CG1_02_44_10]
MSNFDTIIGLEIHAELKTKSKMFCACDNDAQGKEPNTTVCPICLGHPGALPYANKQAIEWTILVGLALDGKVNRLSKFDRKNYFYPDLPKGYQISQYDLPFIHHAELIVEGELIEITRIHLEEDTGKSSHPAGKAYTLVDFNRSGTPLMELVTEPVIRDAQTAKKFCQNYQQILRYLDISNADMEKGEMRCEANISIQEKGKWKYEDGQIKPIGDYKLNPKIEVKNINSFKAVEKAIDYEIKRQERALAEGEKLVQETRGWNENKSATVSQRIKETSADYRYFPEPDLPPIKIDDDWLEKIKKKLVELPLAKQARLISQYNLSQTEAEILTTDKKLAEFTEETISELESWAKTDDDHWNKNKEKLVKLTTNWLTSELFKHLNSDNINIRETKITPENFAELITLLFEKKINSSAGQTILEKMYNDGSDPSALLSSLGLEQMHNKDELEAVVKEIIVKFPNQVADYKAGKIKVIQFLVGQAMSATKGKANPGLLLELFKRLLT